MTARELTPEMIEKLLPAYRILLRAASEEKAATETLPSGQEERAAPSNAAPSDVQHPDQEVTACLSPF